MNETKSTISNATSYEEIGEFWDNHDTADYWEQMEDVTFEIDLQPRKGYFRLEQSLASILMRLAQERGISAETLLNLWVQERLWTERSPTQRKK